MISAERERSRGKLSGHDLAALWKAYYAEIMTNQSRRTDPFTLVECEMAAWQRLADFLRTG
jgi:hypothetical protein